ncbi:multiprotein-bridging factor 1 family protein [Gemmatimonas sp.]|jgi:transcriptional regulator with XRE-family HTH domain|uniref:multiprotein-bridging factor 1 family protein n=1 Tax=Gemmatimonas sp. TaxID=1962908 RepID=UPI0037BEBA38
MPNVSNNTRSYLADRFTDPDFRKQFDREALVSEFAAQVLLVMEDEGYSKAQLASLLKCSRAYVTKLLRGDSNPTLHTLADLAGALNRRVRLQFDEAVTDDVFSNAEAVSTTARVNITRLTWNGQQPIDLSPYCKNSEEVAA